MKHIFLGPVLHWALIAALVGLGWLAGTERLHVTTFNPFLILVLALTVAVLLIVLRTSPGQVTRDPIEDDEH